MKLAKTSPVAVVVAHGENVRDGRHELVVLEESDDDVDDDFDEVGLGVGIAISIAGTEIVV